MCRPKTECAARTLAAAVTLGALLAGCSNLYYDRRDTIALGGGNAVAANMVEQTVDPWPAHSGDVNIATNGQRMQAAVERYRTNKVTPAENSEAPTSATMTAPNAMNTQITVGSTTSPTSTTSATSTTSQTSTTSSAQ